LDLSGCSQLLGKNPFSSLPKSSGKLDKSPEVLVLRGQSPEICALPGPVKLRYFVHLKWMPAQSLWVENHAGGEIKEDELFGQTFTIIVSSKATEGMVNYVETKFRTIGQDFSVVTAVVGCPAASVGSKWTSWDTASGSVEIVAGS